MKKRNFEAQALSKAKTALAKCIGPNCTDFNTRKNYGVIGRDFGKKNVFAQKYDEIRRFDGTNLKCFKCCFFKDNFQNNFCIIVWWLMNQRNPQASPYGLKIYSLE